MLRKCIHSLQDSLLFHTLLLLLLFDRPSKYFLEDIDYINTSCLPLKLLYSTYMCNKHTLTLMQDSDFHMICMQQAETQVAMCQFYSVFILTGLTCNDIPGTCPHHCLSHPIGGNNSHDDCPLVDNPQSLTHLLFIYFRAKDKRQKGFCLVWQILKQ